MGWFSDLGHSIDDSFHSIGNSVDNALHGDFSDAGNYLGQSVSDFQPVFDPAGDIGDYVGDIAQTGGFVLEDKYKRFKNNPLEFLIAGNPLQAKALNKMFGTDYTPHQTMWGLPTNDTYQRAENQGIDTSNFRGAAQVGQAIGSFYAGGPLTQAFGGGALGASLTGATFGGMNALDNGTSLGKGIGRGAVAGGLPSALNLGGMAGITDPDMLRLVNGAAAGGIGAGVRGENIGQGAALGAGGAYLKGQVNNMNQNSLYPEGGQSFGQYNPQADWYGQSIGQSIPSASAGGMPIQQPMPDWLGAAGPGQMQRPIPKQNMLSQLEQNPWFRGLGGLLGGANKDAGQLLDSTGMGRNTFDTIGRTLGSLYTQNRARRDAKEQMNRMDVLRGAYRDDMSNQLARRDAAGGRRSQYGPREVELMARLAQLDQGNAPQLNNLYNQRRAANVGALNDVFTGVRRLGGPQQIYNDVSSYFGQ